MGLFVKQTSERSELQRRLAAELQERAKDRAELEHKPQPDGVKDSNFMRDTKQTTSLAWVWALIVVAVIVVFFIFLIKLS